MDEMSPKHVLGGAGGGKAVASRRVAFHMALYYQGVRRFTIVSSNIVTFRYDKGSNIDKFGPAFYRISTVRVSRPLKYFRPPRPLGQELNMPTRMYFACPGIGWMTIPM